MKFPCRLASRTALLLWCLPAAAALPTIAATGAAPAPPVATMGLLQAGGGMVLVLGLIFLCAWLARRFGLQRLGGGRLLKIVSSAPLGTRERVVLVEVAGTWLVLGVTPSQVNMLHSLPAQTSADAADEPAINAHTMVAQFSSKLREALGGRSPA